MNNIILAIELECTKKKWNHNRLSKESGVDRSTISRYFKRGDNWTRDNMIKLLKAVELDKYIELIKS